MDDWLGQLDVIRSLFIDLTSLTGLDLLIVLLVFLVMGVRLARRPWSRTKTLRFARLAVASKYIAWFGFLLAAWKVVTVYFWMIQMILESGGELKPIGVICSSGFKTFTAGAGLIVALCGYVQGALFEYLWRRQLSDGPPASDLRQDQVLPRANAPVNGQPIPNGDNVRPSA
jgi:hypothetical protein